MLPHRLDSAEEGVRLWYADPTGDSAVRNLEGDLKIICNNPKMLIYLTAAEFKQLARFMSFEPTKSGLGLRARLTRNGNGPVAAGPDHCNTQ